MLSKKKSLWFLDPLVTVTMGGAIILFSSFGGWLGSHIQGGRYFGQIIGAISGVIIALFLHYKKHQLEKMTLKNITDVEELRGLIKKSDELLESSFTWDRGKVKALQDNKCIIAPDLNMLICTENALGLDTNRPFVIIHLPEKK